MAAVAGQSAATHLFYSQRLVYKARWVIAFPIPRTASASWSGQLLLPASLSFQRCWAEAGRWGRRDAVLTLAVSCTMLIGAGAQGSRRLPLPEPDLHLINQRNSRQQLTLKGMPAGSCLSLFVTSLAATK